MLFLFYIYTLPYIAEYEEITNYSQKAYLINSVVDNLYFSSNFWHSPLEYLKDIPPILLFFLIILASLLNFLTTVYTLSFILTIIVNTTRCFIKKVREAMTQRKRKFFVKSWIRGIYSWVSEFNIDRYLAEYSFRINRSQSKETIFNSLIKRLIERKPIFQSQLVCS